MAATLAALLLRGRIERGLAARFSFLWNFNLVEDAMRRSPGVQFFLAVLLCASAALAAPGEAKAENAENAATLAPQTIAQRVQGLDCQPGFLPICWDAQEGKLLLEIERWGEEFLYLTSLAILPS